MTERKVIINELLTFIQNKIDVLDELSVLQICASNFTDLEVETAKIELYSTLSCSQHIIRRKGDDKIKKNIKDIIKVLKETDPDDQPIFVARDLNRLPPITFDYVDVTRLLKDLTFLKNEINCIRTECITKSELTHFETSLRSELTQLRPRDVDMSNTNDSNKLTRTIHTQKTKRLRDKITSKASQPASRTITESAESAASCAGLHEPDDNLSTSNLSLEIDSVVTPTYRDIVTTQSLPMTKKLDNQGINNEFRLVEYKKRKHKTNMRGTLTNKGRIQVMLSQASVYVSRTKKTVNEADIIAHIQDMGEEFVSVELLQQNVETTFNSFKVVVAADRLNRFLDPSFWPTGLVFRRFRERFTKTPAERRNNNN
ncbi:uncharacterized protein LOC123693696 [Colias croceus]|uniref:uncharacterized protein LOC123693696 n=1 Tax=Colias crocea TaxID=72248 RepID=UPI001E27B93F|nr:uncharacterized protein LOC123693696 [Colias croceus]